MDLRYSINHATAQGPGLLLGYVWAPSWLAATRRATGVIARGLPFVVTPDVPSQQEADRRRYAWLYALTGESE